MSAFTDDPSEWQRLDWSLLLNSPIALYYDQSILAEDVNWFKAQGYTVAMIAATANRSAQGILGAIGAALDFPEYFGGNLDALSDCLSDVEIPRHGGLVLVFHDFQIFSEASRKQAEALLDIIATCSRRFLLTGRRFLALVHSANPHIEFEPVGATPVMWNPKEWLNAKRGVE